MTPVAITQGDGPLILGLPHTGTDVPPEIWDKLNALGQKLTDTDWHIERLYDGLLSSVTMVRATFHRYVIDANRDPSGTSLYPGQNTTDLVPLTDFDGQNIWKTPPDAAEIQRRREAFHTPYHAALAAEIERVRNRHGVAVLYDCHSIRSHIPFLFDGTLPDFNIGTNNGVTCDTAIEQSTHSICQKAPFTNVLNGRFKGGWTTRNYGRPSNNIHAIQMELAQSTHLKTETLPFDYDTAKADRLRPYLAQILSALTDLAPKLGAAK